MFTCRNCGGALKYDIASGQLLCELCDSKFDPYQTEQEQDAQRDDYDVTMFKCPQCGGEIYSTDNTAAGFCSFCGASTVLSSRLIKEKRVDYIVPFSQTKEDCKRAYGKLMRRAIYAPKELKKPEYIDAFRGIYMPYWIYHIKQQGHVRLHGTTSHRSGDYIITRHYGLHMDVDAQYKGLPYDASSAFSDDISAKLKPYDVKNMKPFTPSLLSGFYADMSDVEAAVYAEDAKDFSQTQTQRSIMGSSRVKGYAINNEDKIDSMIPAKLVQTNSAMLPVWFLSYRNRDRIAYAAVNGQTGKVVADLPVDIRKYMVGSLVLTVPLFLMLNAFLTIRPTVLLPLVAILAALVILLHAMEMKQIAAKECFENDKGFQEAEKKRRFTARQQAEQEMGAEQEPYVISKNQVRRSMKKKSRGKKRKKTNAMQTGILALIIFGCVVSTLGINLDAIFSGNGVALYVVALVTAGICTALSVHNANQIEVKQHSGSAGWAMLAVLISVLIGIVHPVSDTWYYAGVVIALVTMCGTLVDIIRSYNILATRPLPQFDHKGGDDLA